MRLWNTFWDNRSWNEEEDDTSKWVNWGKLHGGGGT